MILLMTPKTSKNNGNLIFRAIKTRAIHKSYDGDYLGSKSYVYRFGANYLKIIVADDGSVVTAFPSKTDYF
jgi:hypothetical protein